MVIWAVKKSKLGGQVKRVPLNYPVEGASCHFLEPSFFSIVLIYSKWTSQVAQWVKIPPAMRETQVAWVWSLSGEDPLEKSRATHSSILTWRILWTEEPGRLQSIGSQSQTDWSDCAQYTVNRFLETEHTSYLWLTSWKISSREDYKE